MTVSRRLLIGMLLISAAIDCAHARAYYVSASRGLDTNSGTSFHSPWKTIAHVNRQRLEPGDSVLFLRGDTWRETLKPFSSGIAGKPITFGAYGAGAKPVISGNPGPGGIADFSIDNNEQSHIVYDNLELSGAREGLRLYSWVAAVKGITLQNSVVSTGPTEEHGTMSAGVYASVHAGSLAGITIRNNKFLPYPVGLEHWGVYFVKGVTDFRIEGNSFSPAGEDAICIWHSSHGLIARNRGGGNGENTIDVKDSHDVVVSGNLAENDREYNIVIHSVEASDSTYKIVVEQNRCVRGGQAGKLSAGIALLLVRESNVSHNLLEDPFGDGVVVSDAVPDSGNEVSHNVLMTTRLDRVGVALEHAGGTRAYANTIVARKNENN